MGLDLLDTAFRLEKTFGLDRLITRESIRDLKTAGDLVALVEKRVREETPTKEQLVILEESNLRRLRESLAEILGISIDTLKAETKLGEIIPWRKRRGVWRELDERVGKIRIGRKVGGRPSWSWNAGNVIRMAFHIIKTASLALLTLLLVGMAIADHSLIVTVLITLFIFYAACYYATCYSMEMTRSDFVIEDFPPRNFTLRETAQKMSEKVRRRLRPDETPLTHEEIERQVYRILNEVLGVPVDEIAPEKELLRDLGME